MILYHGSNMTIEQIDLEKSKPNKDFGKGFYLSESEEQAMQMATFKSQLLGGESVVTRFEFDNALMHSETLRTKIFEEYSEEWADFVFANTELMRLEATADVKNIASLRVLEKCSFVREGTVRQGKMGSVYCDYAIFGMLREDWEGLHAPQGSTV